MQIRCEQPLMYGRHHSNAVPPTPMCSWRMSSNLSLSTVSNAAERSRYSTRAAWPPPSDRSCNVVLDLEECCLHRVKLSISWLVFFRKAIGLRVGNEPGWRHLCQGCPNGRNSHFFANQKSIFANEIFAKKIGQLVGQLGFATGSSSFATEKKIFDTPAFAVTLPI